MGSESYALVVDDNEMNRRLISRALEENGLDGRKYNVVTASTLEEAAEILIRADLEKLRFDIVVTDTDISGRRVRKTAEAFGGYSLANYLAKFHPGTRVIVHSSAFDSFRDAGLSPVAGMLFYRHVRNEAKRLGYETTGRYALMRRLGIKGKPWENIAKGLHNSWAGKRKRR